MESAAALLAGIVLFASPQEFPIEIHVSSPDWTIGSVVDVEVRTDASAVIDAFQFGLEYDPTLLQPLEPEPWMRGDMWDPDEAVEFANGPVFDSVPTATRRAGLFYVAADLFPGTPRGPGVFARTRFQIVGAGTCILRFPSPWGDLFLNPIIADFTLPDGSQYLTVTVIDAAITTFAPVPPVPPPPPGPSERATSTGGSGKGCGGASAGKCGSPMAIAVLLGIACITLFIVRGGGAEGVVQIYRRVGTGVVEVSDPFSIIGHALNAMLWVDGGLLVNDSTGLWHLKDRGVPNGYWSTAERTLWTGTSVENGSDLTCMKAVSRVPVAGE